jgi:putative ABC transport system permease protein
MDLSRVLFTDVSRDARLAWRSLTATPLVTLVAVASLALGLGANTAIFSVVDGLFLRTLPVRDPDRLVLLTDASASHVRAWSYAVWREIQSRPGLFGRSAAWSFTRFDLAAGGETQNVEGMWASGSLFDTLGVRAIAGRTLQEDDDRPGGGANGPAVVISYRFWQRRFAGAPDAIGRTLPLDGIPFVIVGVTPPGFTGPEIGRAFEVIAPLATEPLVRRQDSLLADTGTTFLTIVARLADGQSADAATASLRTVQPRIRDATLGDIGRFGSPAAIARYMQAPFVLAPGGTGFAGARDLRQLYQRPLQAVMAVVALLLLIACVNVANLLVARAMARRHELSLRLALGASRWRLLRQLAVESAMLYAAGAAAGFFVATWSGRLLVRLISTATNPVTLDLSIDARVLAFTVAITVVTTVIFGTVPAFRASAVAPIEALKQQGRGTAGSRRAAFAGSLIALQVALSLVLVVSAGLFVRTFMALAGRAPGFDPSAVLLVEMDARRTGVDPQQRLALYERVREAVLNLPDVHSAGLSLTTPVGSGQFTPTVEIAGVSDTRGPVWANLISPGWLSAFQTPLVAGRDLTDGDGAGAPRVALVNEAFARKFAAGSSPIGLTFSLYPQTPRRLGPIVIVGVVGDAVYTSLRQTAPPTYYLPLAQFDYLTDLGIRPINLSIRSRSGVPLALSKGALASAAAIDPRLALTPRALADRIDDSLSQERLVALLSGLFGALALLLAGLGLYGVTAYGVASRRVEIGIRMTLGAPAPRVIALVVAHACRFAAIGAAAGVVVSLWLARFAAPLVYGLQPRDPATLAAAAGVLLLTGVAAAWIPARRAVRIDPAAVLRES